MSSGLGDPGDPARLAPLACTIVHARNRWLAPGQGRWLQADPNASALVLIGAGAHSGRELAALVASLDLSSLTGDGVNVYGYLGGNPMRRWDALGLSWDPFDAVDEYLAEDAGSKAAFLDRIVSTAHVAAYIAATLASYIPVPAVSWAGSLALSMMDEPEALATSETWQAIRSAAGAVGVMQLKLLAGKMMVSSAQTAMQYATQFGVRSGLGGIGTLAARAGKAIKTILRVGPPAMVYLGIKDHRARYVGITNDLNRRKREHGSRFKYLFPLTRTLPRTLALAIETAVMLSNPQFENKNIPDKQDSAPWIGVHHVLRQGWDFLPVTLQSRHVLCFDGVYFP